MDMLDFEKLVKSYGKQPGEYTEEELLYLCCVYKVLIDKNEKNWSELVSMLGADVSAEAIRKRASRYLITHPELEKKIITEYGGNINVLLQNRNISFLDERAENYYKQQVKARDIVNEYRKCLREDARIEALKESIQEAARTVETYSTEHWSGDTEGRIGKTPLEIAPTEAVLLLSDWHIGALTNNFYNRFNLEVATNDLVHICDQVIDYCRNLNVYKLNILNLGDLIHGGIHTDSRIEQEYDVITQIEFAGQLLYKVLAKLEKAAPKVTYRSCSDNHSRLMANKSEHIEKENFGRLIDWWVEAKLEQGEHNIIVERDNLDYGLGKFNLLNGKKVMFAHGHEDPINQAYQNFTGATREFIDYILLAHFHNPKEKAFQDCKVIVNGSLVGTEQYALSKRLFAKPCQKLLVLNGDFIDISLQVEDRV